MDATHIPKTNQQSFPNVDHRLKKIISKGAVVRTCMGIGFILTKTPAEEGYNTFIRFLNLFIESDNIIIYLLGNGVYNSEKCIYLRGVNEKIK